jgi:hypothetical protein
MWAMGCAPAAAVTLSCSDAAAAAGVRAPTTVTTASVWLTRVR